jgi:hypothetical protein
VNKLISEIKNVITIKTLVSIVSISAVVPLCKALYWTFETSYFGYFGVGPEIFSRPLFSSGFISVWLFVTAMYPIFMAWTGVMFISFIFLVSFNYKEPKFEYADSTNEKSAEIASKIADKNLEKITWKIRLKAAFSNLGEAIEKSFTIPLVFWIGGILVLLATAFLFLWADKKGRKLAESLVDGYMANGECKDGFNNRVVGCFEISGIDGSHHFVITNNKTHLIYLSPKVSAEDGNNASQASELPKINIIEKSPGETFKLKRTYKLHSENSAPK